MKNFRHFILWIVALQFFCSVQAQEDNTMYVHYINVGQGAAALLEFPCGAILVDAGAQDDDFHKNLMNYLGDFFSRRKDLDSTLVLVMITHPHIDHNEALRDIDTTFHVLRYIDDGLRMGSGKPNQVWMQDNAKKRGTVYNTYSFEQITAHGNKKGRTDSVIDPINCSNGDPQIILYSGRIETKPSDWTNTDFTNYNNQSLVIKVIFGKASFLFTGDLELKGIKNIVETYNGTTALNADVLLVGHHGAANATTEDYLAEVKPMYAVISCGPWDYGKDSGGQFTTYAYGHPRIATINMLQKDIAEKRSPIITVKAADGARNFRSIHIRRQVYATPWDGTISIKATTSGIYSIETEN